MRYCPGCRRINEGWPERCRFCASNWGVRICKRGHFNPIDAIFCGECGSAEMSEAARGGWLQNRIFGLFRGESGWLRYLLKIGFLVLLILILLNNFVLLATFLIAIGLLLAALRLVTEYLSGSIFRVLSRLLRSPLQHRQRNSQSRDRRR